MENDLTQNEQENQLDAATGCFNGIALGIALWLIMGGIGYLVYLLAK